MRLIEADKLKESIESKAYWSAYYPDDVMEYIDEAPTVDAVEVVRCKECKYSFMLEDGTIRCAFHSEREEYDEYGNYYSVWMEPSDFCSYGERREGE